ncbi:MAG TPA: SURF1 family protein [Povalibacter sp.]|uniref:SURF1 family protein n=1 Tax=Povalibacter sp. TaxID=1962978 RepID=UPI002BCEF682|nr:SURF1 family protein [Povalibacter sp.]HMN43904.1 SURF1 family protein [Povalibacter sp.]
MAAIAAIAGLASLGVWQLHRLAWKKDLIHRVDERIHADPVPAPGPDEWPHVTAASSEYRNVRVQGHYLHERETLVQAVTVRGAGFWVVTPLQTTGGYTVLINRGFVLPQYRAAETRTASQTAGETTVTGLLRLSETGRGFLRENDPAADRWYARDVAAIAAARDLTNVAPYFIDAAAGDSSAPGAPVGGLTVVSFRNTHMQYALTWFALALMVAGGAALVFRHEWRLRNPRSG